MPTPEPSSITAWLPKVRTVRWEQARRLIWAPRERPLRRQSEVELVNAEKFSSIAWLYGSNYPGAELTEDWKKALFNQFHDLAPGSGIGVIYKDAQKDFDVVRWSTN